jgi:hypothetical protein
VVLSCRLCLVKEAVVAIKVLWGGGVEKHRFERRRPLGLLL